MCDIGQALNLGVTQSPICKMGLLILPFSHFIAVLSIWVVSSLGRGKSLTVCLGPLSATVIQIITNLCEVIRE